MISVNLKGTVVHGHGKGRTAGFPTANLAYEQETVLPPCGVYAADVTIEGKKYVGVTNIGTRPTADDSAVNTVETWILDCSGDFYGEEIKLKLLSYLKNPQIRFNGAAEGTNQSGCAESEKTAGRSPDVNSCDHLQRI